MTQRHLLLAFGGASPEHEVSVLTAIQAAAALKDSGISIVPLYITKQGRWLTAPHLLGLETWQDINKTQAAANDCHLVFDEHHQATLVSVNKGWFSREERYTVDVALCAFHGGEGENGSFQGLCETYNIPYTGCSVTASSIGMDKHLAKQFCRSTGIPVVDDILVNETEWIAHEHDLVAACEKLAYPLYVKPVTLGSSIGVCRVVNRDELLRAVEAGFRYDERILVEKAVHPLMEINCSVLGDGSDCRASVCEQPLGAAEQLTFEDKYLSSGDSSKGMASASRKIPAPISDQLSARIQELACQIFGSLDCAGVVRMDFLLDSSNERIYFNEVNTIPGSFSFYLWEATRLPFEQLLHELVDIARKRHQKKNSRVRSYNANLLSQKAAKGLKGLKGGK